ncbi:hypothetical protein MYU51_020341 [Penicillium brevicompactum]
MDAATLKLMALAETVQNLMTRSSPGTNWSPEAQSLPEDLNRLSVDELRLPQMREAGPDGHQWRRSPGRRADASRILRAFWRETGRVERHSS